MSDFIKNQYINWLFTKVLGEYTIDQSRKEISYTNLLSFLNSVEFIYSIDRDRNRALDGVGLRYRFLIEMQYDEDHLSELDGPCSVLEMMIALAIRCEESIMDDASKGDRTKQWFWQMIVSLGLGDMTNKFFDIHYCESIINRFLKREYASDGSGGLFTIPGCDEDLCNIEIWVQLLWYLDSRITE